MIAPMQTPDLPAGRGESQSEAQIQRLRRVVIAAAVLVLLICVYSFLVGNGVFSGRFDNDGIAWYFMAKGIFCSLALYLLFKVVEALPGAR